MKIMISKLLKQRLLFLCSVGLVIAFAIHYLILQQNLPKIKMKPQYRSFEVQLSDLSALKKSNISIPELASALMRLATQRNPKAKEKALEIIDQNDSSPILKEIAIRALGYFDDPDLSDKLDLLAKSENANIRKAAILALSLRKVRH